MNKYFLCCFTMLVISLLSSFARPKPILWNMERLEQIKTDQACMSVKQNTLDQGNRYLKNPLATITDAPKTFVGDKHYYTSMSYYAWPDESKGNGVYKIVDGKVNPEVYSFGNSKLSSLQENLRYMSICYYLTGDQKYYDFFLRQLKAWFVDEETYMYPTFEYAQILPGYNNNKGLSSGMIELYSFNNVLESIRLMHSCKKIDRKTLKAVNKWFAKFGDWIWNSDYYAQLKSDAGGNIWVATDVVLYNIFQFTKNKSRIRILENEMMELIDSQIDNEGKQNFELRRTKAYSYSIFNLTHIVDFCIMEESCGKSFYNKNKDVIDKAFAYLVSYLGNQDSFPYQQITSWSEEEENLKFQVKRLKRLTPKNNSSFDWSLYNQSNLYQMNRILE